VSRADDAFAPTGDMLTAAQARAALTAAVEPVRGRDSVGLFEAAGRVLAADVVSGRAVPPCDNSAVDGYAVCAGDLDPDGEVALPVTGRVVAGGTLGRPGRRGEAARIFTGAPVPEGYDTILPQEVCREASGNRIILPGARRGSNLRRAGEDIEAGAVALRAGTRLRPQEIGLAASIGLARLEVVRRPRVAVFSTGDELREPGQPAEGAAIHDSNRYILAALLGGLGCVVEDFGIVPDRPAAVRDALAGAAAGCDAVLTSGGVSTGEEDHVRAAVEALGRLEFWRVAIRPGRPLAFGRIGAVPFLGLPGNPVAVMVTFLMLARPLIQTLAGAAAPPPRGFPVTAGFAAKKRVGRREWLRATIRRTPDGRAVADRFPRDGSGILTSMTESDGLVELPEELDCVREGDAVDFLPFSELL